MFRSLPPASRAGSLLVLALFVAPAGAAAPPSRPGFKGHRDGIFAVAVSPDGKLIASAGRDATVRVWDAAGNPLHLLRGHGGQVLRVCFSRDGKFVASA